MKLKDGFIIQEVDGEQIIVSAGNMKFNGIVRSNKTAAFIVNCLKTNTTEHEIISKMMEKYDASEDLITSDVKSVLNKLKSIGAIDD